MLKNTKEKLRLMKKCNKCGKEKPATRDHFSSHQHTRDRLSVECLACNCERQWANRQNNSDRIYATYYKWKDNLPALQEMCDLFAYKIEDINERQDGRKRAW